jgi:hypothetical protein
MLVSSKKKKKKKKEPLTTCYVSRCKIGMNMSITLNLMVSFSQMIELGSIDSMLFLVPSSEELHLIWVLNSLKSSFNLLISCFYLCTSITAN